MGRRNYISTENRIDYDIDLTFPAHVIRGAAGIFTETYSSHLESPKQYLFATFLTFLGAMLSDRIRLASLLNVQPRLYTVLVGESATARKSTALEMAANHFPNIYISYKVGSGEGLARVLSEHSIVLFYLDELATLLSQSKQEASTLLSLITQLFSRNVAENQLRDKDKSYRVENAYLSVVAACTTATYQRMFDEAALDIGLVNRLLLIHGEPTKRNSNPEPLSDIELKEINDSIKQISLHYTNTIMRRTPNANNVYRDWYQSIDVYDETTKRIDVYCDRLSLLLAANSLETTITKDIQLDAIDLADWQIRVRKYYQPLAAPGGVGAVEERIEKVLLFNGRMDFWQLYARSNAARYGGRKAFDNAIANMIAHGVIRSVNTGHKRKSYELTPEYAKFTGDNIIKE